MKTSIAEQAEEALRRHVVAPLQSRIVDESDGGFLVDFDERWRPVGLQEKSLEYIARTTIAFAQIARAIPGQGFDRYVRHGCSFLQQVMWDPVNGGFFCRVDRSGRPMWDGLKHPHAATYAGRAFLLAEPYLPSGEGLMWSKQILAWLDDVAWDASHGGYWGSFRRDNQRYADGTRLPTPDGRDVCGLVPGFREINTHGDAMEFLTDLAKRDAGGRHGIKRLQAMTEILANRLIQPNGAIPFRYLPDWRPAPELDYVGYNFQVARYLLQAARLVPTVDAVAEASRLVDFGLSSARHPDGGFCFAVAADGRSWQTRGAPDLRQWWVQIEAVHALHRLANVTSLGSTTRRRYRDARDEQWRFIRDAFFDDRYGGLHEIARCSQGRSLRHRFFGRPRSQGSALPRKAHAWKDASHEVNLFLALASAESSEDAPTA